MNEQQPDAEKSLCWGCKHGMCIRELHQEHLLQMGGQRGDDPFGMQSEDDDDLPEAVGHMVEHEHVRTTCFWRPEGVLNVPPLLFGFIKQCSRFQAED